MNGDFKIERDFLDEAESDRPDAGAFAVAYAILQLSGATESVASALRRLGTADAATPFGAIEALCMEVGRVADAIDSVASEVSTP